jgi:hypothetical protein
MKWSSGPVLWATITASVICFLLMIAAIVAPTWIESSLGFSPDNGSGEVEWGLAACFGVVALVAALGAGLQWRRMRATCEPEA